MRSVQKPFLPPLQQLTLKISNKNFKFFLVAGRLNDQDKIHADESSVNNSAGSSTDNKWVFWSCFEISDLVQFKRVSLIVLRVLSQSEIVLRANRKSVSVWSNLIKTNLMNFQENLHRAVGVRHLAGTVDFYLFWLFIVRMKFQLKNFFFQKISKIFIWAIKSFDPFLIACLDLPYPAETQSFPGSYCD